MRRRIKILAYILVCLLISCTLTFPQSKSVSWSSFNMGYEVSTSTDHGMKSAVGQIFVDESQQSERGLLSGFLADTSLRNVIFSNSVTVTSSWNMVSVPVIASSYLKSFLFPTALSAAFSYESLYIQQDALKTGIGYWVKFPVDQAINFLGNTITTDTINVKAHWNIIGSISYPIAVSNITSFPPGIKTSNFFSYNGSGYQTADTIKPGRGYWLKVSQNGKLILSTILNPVAANRIKIIADSELPPAPPEYKPAVALPKEFVLRQNYPNPFNPSTVIRYELSKSSFVSLKIYTLLGQEVKTVAVGVQNAGYQSVSFDARNLPSGVYFYRLQAGKFSDVKKMLLMR